jgi:spore coat protein H
MYHGEKDSTMMKRKALISASISIVALLLAQTACTPGQGASTAPTAVSKSSQGSVARPQGWSEESHGKKAASNYDVVFPQDKVNQIKITIAPSSWEAMQANMTELYGEPGRGRQGPGAGAAQPAAGNNAAAGAAPQAGMAPPGGAAPQAGGDNAAAGGFPPGGAAPQAGGPGAGGRGAPPAGGGGPGPAAKKPMWVTATVEFEGQTWTNVGVRYKGNSSLMSTWSSASAKLPLKLDFDQFEDDYPEITDQRFYGFKQISLGNNFSDRSALRETIGYDVFRDVGLVAARTGFYEVILDHGEGPTSLGLYTAVEVIDDTVVKRSFKDDSGNLYEADGPAASLAKNTADRIETSFEKKNNEKEADWSDIKALYDILHSEERTADPQAWRAKLEAVFDVDTFLKWLAASAVIQHWDTYGAMTHNFYLYHDPTGGKLTWISWDHNMILMEGMGGQRARCRRCRPGGRHASGWCCPPGGRRSSGWYCSAGGRRSPSGRSQRRRRARRLPGQEDCRRELAADSLPAGRPDLLRRLRQLRQRDGRRRVRAGQNDEEDSGAGQVDRAVCGQGGQPGGL